MRLDKFLKVSRLIKRRTVAKEICDKGRVSVNGQTAKAGTNIKKGDEIVIQFGLKQVTLKVNDVKENAKKEEANSMYTVIREEKLFPTNEMQ